MEAVARTTVGDNLKPFAPVLSGIVNFLLIVVLLFFLLYSRTDLRDRIVRLAARARISVASQAIETAGHTVSRYLILFSLTNLAFGVSTGLVCWMIGLPTPELWGLLGFLFRYIPYIGALMAALLPTAVAFAVFPGWDKSIEVLVAFIAIDQIAAQFIELNFRGVRSRISEFRRLNRVCWSRSMYLVSSGYGDRSGCCWRRRSPRASRCWATSFLR